MILDILGSLKLFLKQLRSHGMRYIWQGTQAEWDALSDAERGKYNQAEITSE